MVHRLRRRFGDEVPGMVDAWRQAQGLEPGSFWMGDVWLGESGLPILIRGWESTLTRLARHERLVPPGAVQQDAQGRITVEAFPTVTHRSATFQGVLRSGPAGAGHHSC